MLVAPSQRTSELIELADTGRRRARSVTVHLVERSRRILLVEDDQRIGASLSRALSSTGYICTWATSGHEAIDAVRNGLADGGFDLVLLDLGLPDVDGLDVCRRLVGLDGALPIIMLTARDDELDIVVGLDAGAIDYVSKPFSLAPLLARIRAQLRRVEYVQDFDKEPMARFDVGALMIDLRRRHVELDGSPVQLRPKEFDLLVRLAHDVDAVVTRETLMNDVWDEHWFGSTKTLDFHIASLRARLDVDRSRASVITTIRGIGFRLEANPPTSGV
jgi:DNA-binding response OmpR family regulator